MNKILILSILLSIKLYAQNHITKCDLHASSNVWNTEFVAIQPSFPNPQRTAGVQINQNIMINNMNRGAGVVFNNCPGSEQDRVWSSHGVDLSNSSNWQLDFYFQFTGVGQGGPGHILAGLTNQHHDPISESYPLSLNNDIYTPTIQDGIFVNFSSLNHTNDNSTFMIEGVSKNNEVLGAYSEGFNVKINTLYFIRLERINKNQGQISVYNGTDKTILLSSKFFPIDNEVDNNLPFIQHGVLSYGGSDRDLTASIDGICLSTTPNSVLSKCDIHTSLTIWNTEFVAIQPTLPTPQRAPGVTINQNIIINNVNRGAGVVFNNCPGSEQDRIWSSHGVDVSNSSSWKLDFYFQFTGVGQGGPGHILAGLTSQHHDPISESYPLSLTNGVYIPTSQDGIFVNFASTNHTNNNSSFMIQGVSKNNEVLGVYSEGFNAKINTLYFISLERINKNQGQISVFNGNDRTILLSSKFFSIDNDVDNELPFIQHGVLSYGGLDRDLTAIIDGLCLSTSTSTASIEENSEIYTSRFIYPNPSTGVFNVEYKESTVQKITVMNAIGQIILEIPIDGGTKITSFNLSSYDAGIYFVQVHSGNEKIMNKIIKQ